MFMFFCIATFDCQRVDVDEMLTACASQES